MAAIRRIDRIARSIHHDRLRALGAADHLHRRGAAGQGASAIEMIDSSMMIASVAVRRPMPALYPRRTKPHLTIVNAGR